MRDVQASWWRRREIVAGVVLVVSLALGLVAGSFAGAVTVQKTSTPTPTIAARVLPTTSPAPVALRTCSVNDLVTDSRLGEVHARVMNSSTGEVLFDRDGATPNRPASVMKVLTAAAALAVLGPDYRFTTRVVAGPVPGSVVLVGGGDPTLTDLPSGVGTLFGSVAHLDELAAMVRASWDANPSTTGTPITTVFLDSSRYSGPDWHPTWNTKELGDGTTSKVVALMVNTGRADAQANTSPRDEDPVGRAGAAFAALLGASEVTLGSADPGATVLGEVSSPTIADMLPQILLYSDNTAAEALAFETAIAEGAGNSFDALGVAIPQALTTYGLDTSDLIIVDGSGLSDSNAVSPAFVTQLMRKVVSREGNLGLVFDQLPVARQKGSLRYSDRFVGDNAVVDGRVWAKTGWIDTGYTLAGIVAAADETPLSFAIYALGDVDSSAKQAIDNWVVGLYRCGNQLSNR